MNGEIASIVLVTAVAAHLISALVYVRVLHAHRGPFARLVYAFRELALFVMAVVAADAAPWTAYVFAAYVCASAIGRVNFANEVQNPSTSGAARLMIRR